MLLERLPSDSTCVVEAELGELDIKGCEPGIPLIGLQVRSLFKLAIMTYVSIFASTSLTKYNIMMTDKGACREIDIV